MTGYQPVFLYIFLNLHLLIEIAFSPQAVEGLLLAEFPVNHKGMRHVYININLYTG